MTKKGSLPYSKILVLDIAERDRTSLALITENLEPQIICESVRAQELPKLMDAVMKENTLLPDNIDALGIVKREGSMTAIRIGTAVANTFGWINNKPIIEVGAENLKDAIEKIERGDVDRIVKVSPPFA